MTSVDGSKSLQVASDKGSEFECDPCGYENMKIEAKFYCYQCNDYLCSSCKSAHQKLSVSRNHHVVFGSSMPRKETSKTEIHSHTVGVKCSCNGKDVTIYCKAHKEVICVDCQKLKHRKCKSSSIDEAYAEAEPPNKEQILEEVQELKGNVEELRDSRSKDMETLEIQTSECRRNVKEFKKKLVEQIEKLEETTLSEVADYDNKQRKDIEQHIDTCSTALIKLNSDCQLFESTTTAEKRLTFIHNLQLSKTIEYVHDALKDMRNEVVEPNISFEDDQTVLREGIKSLGTVRTTGLKDSRPVIADMTVKSTTRVNVKDPSDSWDPYLTGSLFMPSGELVLCDKTNAIKVLNIDLTLKEQIKIPTQPWDIAVMSHDEVVISLPNTKSLTFLKVYSKLQIGSSIQLDQVCRGVAVSNGSIYVSCDNGEVRILDRAGNQLKNVYSTLKFSLPFYRRDRASLNYSISILLV